MVDTVVIKPQEHPEAPEGHDEKMAAKVDAANAALEQSEDGEVRPEWLPEKFKTTEDMAKAYGELESKMGKPKDSQSGATEDVTTNIDAPQSEVKAELETKGLSLDTFSKEFSEKGELSPDSYKALLDAGYDKTLVDGYIAGQQALASNHYNSVVSEVGGADAYTELVSWAKSTLPQAEIDAYNDSVQSGDIARTRLAVAGLNARFSAENGNEPSLLGGQGRQSTAGDSFESMAQVTAAMKDPRYKVDPAFRKQVQAKLSRSDVL